MRWDEDDDDRDDRDPDERRLDEEFDDAERKLDSAKVGEYDIDYGDDDWVPPDR